MSLITMDPGEGVGSPTGDAIIMFGSAQCGPCKVMKARLDRLSEAVPNLPFRYVPLETNTGAFRDYGIRSIPAFIAMRDGKVKDRLLGPVTSPVFAQWVTDAFKED